MVFLWYRRHSRALGALTSVHPIDVFCPHLEPSAGFNKRQTSKFFTLFNHLLIFLAHPSHLYNTQASMLRQPGTQIKCVGYRTLEPVISTRSLMCLCRLTNVSIVRMKKGGKRFEVSFAVQVLKTSLISQ